MKAVFFAIVAFAVSALANPVLSARQLDAESAEIDKLTAIITQHTANINKTTAAAPENPTLAQQNEAGAALAPDFQAITEALTSATTILTKRDFIVGAITGRGACSSDCLLLKVKFLVYEIACTLKFVIVKLGLACVLAYLTPLIVALSGLLKCLDKVVAGLLFAVKGILSSVLGGLAAGLLGLII
ncbi:hypothetical protein B0T16DRAFT_438345 [Cercophora newfieldiana]|uniref:Uncharacterized protein n=1 Tax=Cercophora newfieldiana TaxID=92897 RepID=A0AA39Y1G5_9PEZI|nr:hypothetical protein B0T16DRAFT_438345 [Cercophora newfieldiana]